MPPEKPPKNKKGKARHTTDQQPSLLDQLELDEEQAPEKQAPEKQASEKQASEKQAPENHRPEDSRHESPGYEDGDEQHADEAGAPIDSPQPAEEEEQPEPASEQPSEPLKQAYVRYTEIVNDTYNSTFSDVRRQAAFKEAAKAHRVKITDLKRYSTAAALGIPYNSNTDADPEPGAETPASETD